MILFPHSTADVITNSSTELFLGRWEGTEEEALAALEAISPDHGVGQVKKFNNVEEFIEFVLDGDFPYWGGMWSTGLLHLFNSFLTNKQMKAIFSLMPLPSTDFVELSDKEAEKVLGPQPAYDPVEPSKQWNTWSARKFELGEQRSEAKVKKAREWLRRRANQTPVPIGKNVYRAIDPLNELLENSILIVGTGDNSIPYEIWPQIQEVFRCNYSHHLG